jgi:hypothetical protein
MKVDGGEKLYQKLIIIVFLESHELENVVMFANIHCLWIVIFDEIHVQVILADHEEPKISIDEVIHVMVDLAIESLIHSGRRRLIGIEIDVVF